MLGGLAAGMILSSELHHNNHHRHGHNNHVTVIDTRIISHIS